MCVVFQHPAARKATSIEAASKLCLIVARLLANAAEVLEGMPLSVWRSTSEAQELQALKQRAFGKDGCGDGLDSVISSLAADCA
eukprot:SAG31_NODE_13580_length_859_cov_1.686842_2_plen_83_part_01